jgi:hypothetical protein
MNWSTLDSIDWDSVQTTADWVKTLNDLQGLISSADTPDKRSQLAGKLDEFADHSSSEDLATIIKLDAAARKAARALRNENIAQRISELSAASADYQAAVKEFSAASAILKKEASVLRAEKLTQALSSLTDTISALKTLSNVIGTKDDELQLATAITQASQSAQKLRALLEEAA